MAAGMSDKYSGAGSFFFLVQVHAFHSVSPQQRLQDPAQGLDWVHAGEWLKRQHKPHRTWLGGHSGAAYGFSAAK
jgi:hypothetical protein